VNKRGGTTKKPTERALFLGFSPGRKAAPNLKTPVFPKSGFCFFVVLGGRKNGGGGKRGKKTPIETFEGGTKSVYKVKNKARLPKTGYKKE